MLGANGSGKSTLLSLIYGDLHPALGGTIERAGLSVGDAHRGVEASRRVGFTGAAGRSLRGAVRSRRSSISGRYASVGLNAPPTAADRRSARRWLEFFGIAALRDRGPRSVSYGQMRLALIARAMVNDPELLLLDEPCTGLDGDMREHVLREIERLARSGTQIVMAVHDAEDIVPSVRNVLRPEEERPLGTPQTCTSASYTMTASPTMRTDCATRPDDSTSTSTMPGRCIHMPCRPRNTTRPSFGVMQSVRDEVDAEHAVRVAADRIFGNAERRHEHARLGAHARLRLGEREHEIAFRADVRSQPRQLFEIRLDRVEQLARPQTDQQPRAALGHRSAADNRRAGSGWKCRARSAPGGDDDPA